MLFAPERPVDQFDMIVGDLVHLLFGSLEFIGGNDARLLRRLEVLAGIATQVARHNASVLRQTLDDLDVLLASLLGERGDVEPDDHAVVGRGDAEVALADSTLDRGQRRAVVGLDDQLARLGHLETGQLLQRDRGAVVLDHDPLDQRRRCPARAHCGELRLHVLDGLVHLFGGFQKSLFDHGDQRTDALVHHVCITPPGPQLSPSAR